MDYEDLFLRGDTLHEAGDFSSAFESFALGAKAGDVSCMNRLAAMYTSGEGVACNYDEAIVWELKAVDCGDHSAMLNVGISYRMKGNIRKARYWFEKSLESGEGGAALELAKLYLVSDKEIDTVRRYLELAVVDENLCQADHEEATCLLATITPET